MKITEAELKNRMFYTRPDEATAKKHEEVQQLCFEYGKALLRLCPNPSRELSLAISKLEEARMWANASIAHRQDEEENTVGKIPAS